MLCVCMDFCRMALQLLSILERDERQLYASSSLFVFYRLRKNSNYTAPRKSDTLIPKVVEQGMEHVSANDRTALGTSLTRDFSIFTEVEREVKNLNQQGKRVVQIIYGGGNGAIILNAWILWERWE